MYRIKNTSKVTKNDRFAQIAKLGQTIFHAKDLANLWQITNSNTLYTTLKRYVQKGLLFRIYKGLFSIKPIKELDPVDLGFKALHSYSYLSTETVLVKVGIILQKISYITLVGSKSKKFEIAGNHYKARKLADRYLYNPEGVINKGHIKIAAPERAIADLLHFNPHIYFDGKSLIDWRAVRKLQQAIGYDITPRYYDFTKSSRRRA